MSTKKLRALAKALKANDLEDVEAALEELDAVALNSRELGYDLLPLAVASGNEEMVQALLDAGCSVNGTDKRGRSALAIAYTDEQLEMFELLLQRGANPNVVYEKSTLFNSTIEEELPQFQEAMLTHCKDTLNIQFQGKDKRTALMSAITTDMVDTAVLLLGDPWNADPGIPNKEGEYPVHVAASLGHVKVLDLLGKPEANRPDKTPSKSTPLMHAAEEGSIDAMEKLLALGADAKAANTEGMTALHFASLESSGSEADIAGLEVLLGAGADVNAVTKKGHTPLDVAAGWASGQEVLKAAGGEERTAFEFEDDTDSEGSESASDDGGSDDEPSVRKLKQVPQFRGPAKRAVPKGAIKEAPTEERKLSCGQWAIVILLLASCIIPVFMPLLEYFAGPEDFFGLFDKDGDTRVSLEEYEAGYLMLTKKKAMDSEGLSQFHGQDVDRDGFLSWGEFLLPKGADPTPADVKSKAKAKTQKKQKKQKSKTKKTQK